MKNSILFGILAVALVGCNRDGDSGDSTSFKGENWKATKEVLYDGKTGNLYSTNNYACGELLEFTTSTNVRTTEYNSSCVKKNVYEGNYSYNPKTKVIIIDDEESLVKSKTSTELQLEDEYYDKNNDGVPEKQVIFYTKK